MDQAGTIGLRVVGVVQAPTVIGVQHLLIKVAVQADVMLVSQFELAEIVRRHALRQCDSAAIRLDVGRPQPLLAFNPYALHGVDEARCFGHGCPPSQRADHRKVDQ
ncbi:hypothetical protein D3C76_1561130 [compost metagenome]